MMFTFLSCRTAVQTTESCAVKANALGFTLTDRSIAWIEQGALR